MLSDQPLHITRGNYETYFLLYIDNELDAEGRLAVESFALLHPDLQEELYLLQDTKLEGPEVSFGDKSSLMAAQMNSASFNEDLLLYLDNELTEKGPLELALQNQPALRNELALLQRTKLDPDELVSYPWKNELYRNETQKRPGIWFRVAAAVLVLAGIGNYLVMQQNEQSSGITPLATNTTVVTIPAPATIPVKVSGDPEIVPGTTSTETTAGIAEAAMQTEKDKHADQPAKNTETPNAIAIRDVRNNTETNPQDATTMDAMATRTQQLAQVTETNTVAGRSEIINSDAVTATIPVAYNDTEAATEVPGNAREKQSSVRGMLRKATRFIERRTGFNPVNDDNQLLVGAVSISLK